MSLPSLKPVLRSIAILALMTGITVPGSLPGADDTIYLGGAHGPQIYNPQARIQPGGVEEFSFFFIDPSSNIQGFTIAACFESPLIALPGSFSIENTVLEDVGAEYVEQQFDNDDDDGDGREILIGILVDYLPPFAGQTVPPSFLPQEIGYFEFYAPEDAQCFECYTVEFCDNINGTGGVFLSNRVVIGNQSIPPVLTYPGQVCVPATALFIRGDSNNDGIVDVADPIFSLHYLFTDGVQPSCMDAADADDDGFYNITDVVFTLYFVFGIGIAPPYPYPECGLEDYPGDDEFNCIQPSGGCPECP